MVSAKAVGIFMIVVIAILIALDVYLAKDGVAGNTFSARFLRAANHSLGAAMPYGIGYLAGHLFASSTAHVDKPGWMGLSILVVGAVSMWAIDRYVTHVEHISALLVGVGLAYTFWPNIGQLGE